MFKINGNIGNTPMIKINYTYEGKQKSIYTKLEYFNLTGSAKDRVAYYIIKKAKDNNELKENTPIVEATSGNTGISLSALGALYKHPVYIFMPEWVSKERVKLIESYGAIVKLITKEQGGFKRCIIEAEKLAKEKKFFYAKQFSNFNNYLAHYETTGEEILKQMKNVEISGFLSGVGTGGTLMGIGKKLKEKNNKLKIVAIEPEKMPLISKNIKLGEHKIEGIGDDFVPQLLDKNILDKIILINDDDAINMSKKIAKELGIGVGISSGANFIGSVLLQKEVDGNIVTIFTDDNKKYITTDLFKNIKLEKDSIINKIKLENYELI